MRARCKGLEKCCKIYISGITSHPKTKKIQLRTQLIEMVLDRRGREMTIRWNMICNVANSINALSPPNSLMWNSTLNKRRH
eukprot:5763357-Ditylum_brightwellii.AAC.1